MQIMHTSAQPVVFLRTGHYDDAMKAFESAQKYTLKVVDEKRPIVVVDDRSAILLRLKNFLLTTEGYDDIQTVENGKSAINLVSKLVKLKQNPIILLDMEMPNLIPRSM